MGTLSFFPWLRLDEPIDVGPIHLVQYKRESRPGGADQAVVDIVTEPYWQARSQPIRAATLFRYDDKGLLDELAEEDIPVLFELASLVTAAGLSARDFFRWKYWNRDNFYFTVQRYSDPGRGSFIQTRRLDGSNNIYIPQPQLVVAQPIHTVGTSEARVDADLLAALLRLRDCPDWPRFREALHGYNLASTDSADLPIETALILINGALEQLLGSDSGREADIVAKFLARFRPRETVEVSYCDRFRDGRSTPVSKYDTVRERWIRDIFRLRGDFAHGRVDAKYPSAWTTREHLLLASFVVPLLLKLELADRELYTLTNADPDGIDAFEALCCADHFTEAEDDGSVDLPWHEILSHAGLTRLVDKWFGEEPQSPTST